MTINLNINQTLILFMADGNVYTYHRKNIYYMFDNSELCSPEWP